MASKPHHCYIAIAHCNFDDVMLGVYPPSLYGFDQASARCRAVEKDPKLRFVDNQACDTEFLHAKVYFAKGTKFTVANSWDPGAKRRKAATA